MSQSNPELETVINYMKSHWPSEVKTEWQVAADDYFAAVQKVLQDFTAHKTSSRHLVRIAGLSGSGKTTQLLPAVEAYFEKQNLSPILVAARRFAPYHPHYKEISDFYGEKNVRKLTDEFSTIMMFLVLSELIKNGFDIILDVTLLDPTIENILIKMLQSAQYHYFITMIAISPEVAEQHLGGRSWRHSRETELEFIRATTLALEFYAQNCQNTRLILWNTYKEAPIYDGKISNGLSIFTEQSKITKIPSQDEKSLREAKIKYFTSSNLVS